MGDYNIDDALLANPHEALVRLFNISYINIAWAIRNGPKYLKDPNIAETFQQFFICVVFLISIKSSL